MIPSVYFSFLVRKASCFNYYILIIILDFQASSFIAVAMVSSFPLLSLLLQLPHYVLSFMFAINSGISFEL